MVCGYVRDRNGQYIIFVIRYYRITIASEQRYLQGIKVFYTLGVIGYSQVSAPFDF